MQNQKKLGFYTNCGNLTAVYILFFGRSVLKNGRNKFFLFFKLLILFIFSGGLTYASGKLETNGKGDEIFKLVRPMVYQVKTSKDAISSKASYGTGFVVDYSGLLITNYHVVSEVIQDEDKRYKLFIVDDEKSIPAEIVSFSVIHDLAIIKVNRKFEKILTIYDEKPIHGETIYSIGLPKDLNMSIVDGTYNGVISHGIYEKIFMSTPINSGMSGGPTVNVRGEVVGVNVSVLVGSQNISFAVPADKALELLKKYRDSPKRIEEGEVDLIVEKQLLDVENNLMGDLVNNPGENDKIGVWSFAPPSKSLKCWTTTDKDRKKQFEYAQQSCFLKSGSYIKRGKYSGSYSIAYRTFKNIKMNRVQFISTVGDIFNSGFVFKNMFLSIFSRDDMITKYSCDETIIVNEHYIPFKVSYCINGFIDYKTIFRINIKAATLLKGDDALIFEAELDGFSKESIFDFINYHLSNIKKAE